MYQYCTCYSQHAVERLASVLHLMQEAPAMPHNDAHNLLRGDWPPVHVLPVLITRLHTIYCLVIGRPYMYCLY